MSIGNNIRNARKKKGYTQKQLAELAGIASITLQQYELEKRKPQIDQLLKLSTALNVNINDLLESPLDNSPLYHYFKDDSISDNPVGRRYINAELTIQVDDWQQIDIELVKKFKKLNESGKAIAIERVEELTEIPRYTQKEKPDKE